MTSNENQYLNLLKDILENGEQTGDRTGTGTLSVFGRQLRFDLSGNKMPLLTTKKVFWKGVVVELLWLLRGETNIKFLHEYGVKIWDEWADESGDLGPVYGRQWRKWETNKVANLNIDTGVDYVTIDQIANVIHRIKTNPNCRRLIVSAWNPADIDTMKLPPCHAFFQFKVYGNKLSCQLYQRSADMFLGVPFNIASYSLLTHLIAKECGLEASEFIHTFGDAHIYNNHIEQVREQLKRQPLEGPTVGLNIIQGGLLEYLKICSSFPWSSNSKLSISNAITLNDYQSHATIKAEVSV